MKLAVLVYVVACLAVLAVAAPVDDAQIVRQDSDVGPDGYTFAVETSDGKTHQEQGTLKNLGGEEPSISVSGSYSFVADDGLTYVVEYVADENGYQPKGAHLPHN